MRARLQGLLDERPEVFPALNPKQAALDSLIAEIPTVTTFQTIGRLIGRSDEWVRLRLHKDSRIFRLGKSYRVPKVVAEELIRSTLL